MQDHLLPQSRLKFCVQKRRDLDQLDYSSLRIPFHFVCYTGVTDELLEKACQEAMHNILKKPNDVGSQDKSRQQVDEPSVAGLPPCPPTSLRNTEIEESIIEFGLIIRNRKIARTVQLLVGRTWRPSEQSSAYPSRFTEARSPRGGSPLCNSDVPPH